MQKDIYINNSLEKSRKKLLEIDKKIIRLLGERMSISSEIGIIKREKNIDLEQAEYWKETENIRKRWAEENNIENGFIKKLFKAIRKESLRIQKK